MPIEVSCGQCHGLLLVETPGLVVACPHCGTHLSVPASDLEGTTPAASEPETAVPESEVIPITAEASVAAVGGLGQPVVAAPQPLVETSGEQAVTPAADSQPAPTLGQSLPELAAAAGCPWFAGSDVPVTGIAAAGLIDPHHAFNFSDPIKFTEIHKLTEAMSTPVAVPMSEPIAQVNAASLGDISHNEPVAEAPAAAVSPTTEVPPTRSGSGSSSPVTEDDSELGIGFSCSDEGATELVPGSSPKLFASDTAIVEAASLASMIAGEQPVSTSTANSPEVVNGEAISASPPSPLVSPPSLSVPANPADWTIGFPAAALPSGMGSPSAETWSFGEENAKAMQGHVAPGPAAAGVASLASADWSGTTSGSVTSPEQDSIAAVQTQPKQAVEMVPRQWFNATVSYASLVTLIMVYLLVTRWTAKPHQLESLPDLIPKLTPKTGQPKLEVAPPSANVAPGHRLKIGETGRFGSLQVTPIKVTCGPITFEHAFERDVPPRHPSLPVLKLWLAFHNVSTNQTFPPLGEELLFRRKYDHRFTYTLTNNFVAREEDRLKNGPTCCLYDLPVSSEFRIVGLEAAREVQPGQTIEMFLPSDEEGADLIAPVTSEEMAPPEGTAPGQVAFGKAKQGDANQLVWRVQFRKGYHPESFRGVTTLIDIVFSPSDVLNEQADADAQKLDAIESTPTTQQST